MVPKNWLEQNIYSNKEKYFFLKSSTGTELQKQLPNCRNLNRKINIIYTTSHECLNGSSGLLNSQFARGKIVFITLQILGLGLGLCKYNLLKQSYSSSWNG